MEIYNYSPETGAYVSTSCADESPLEPGVFLFPAYSTTIEPPPARDGFIRRFVSGQWGYSPLEQPKQEPTPEPKPAVPETITDRQFFAVLEKMGRITYEEALQAVKTGDLPPAFEAFLASLEEDKRKSYRLFMEGETFFSRNHQITLDLAAFFKMTDQQVDAIFIQGEKL